MKTVFSFGLSRYEPLRFWWPKSEVDQQLFNVQVGLLHEESFGRLKGYCGAWEHNAIFRTLDEIIDREGNAPSQFAFLRWAILEASTRCPRYYRFERDDDGFRNVLKYVTDVATDPEWSLCRMYQHNQSRLIPDTLIPDSVFPDNLSSTKLIEEDWALSPRRLLARLNYLTKLILSQWQIVHIQPIAANQHDSEVEKFKASPAYQAYIAKKEAARLHALEQNKLWESARHAREELAQAEAAAFAIAHPRAGTWQCLTRAQKCKLAFSKPLTKLGADFGVSDVMMRRRFVQENIPLPPRGYFLTRDRRVT